MGKDQGAGGEAGDHGEEGTMCCIGHRGQVVEEEPSSI